MTLEAARAGFSQKQADVRKEESERELEVLAPVCREGGELEAEMKDSAAIMEGPYCRALWQLAPSSTIARLNWRAPAASEAAGICNHSRHDRRSPAR